ncbi:uncharacterized protein C8R40DRAFT_323701 [Lentinula edodes]|uniref:uncharacterized protein n=1 Tax=Lentinula edodes TaxID=5353 RepID=UPI001E8D926D|nr:uncharacterized protein C8R40DRAFT_323701 [Lentinula edodes]KAH7874488.1 hypothetical protein C8R40DRAFT_323701 [Lentinula edodes]
MLLVSIHTVVIVFGLFNLLCAMPVSVNNAVGSRSDDESQLSPRRAKPLADQGFNANLVPSGPALPPGGAPTPPRTGSPARPPTEQPAGDPATPSTGKVWITFADATTSAHNSNPAFQQEVTDIVKRGLARTAAFSPERHGERIFDFRNSFPGNSLAQRQVIHCKVEDDWPSGQCGSGCLGSVAFVDDLGPRSFHGRVRALDEDEHESYERYPRVSLPPPPPPSP